MRVLLDECLPRRLKRELVGHDARTVPEMGGPASGMASCSLWLPPISTCFSRRIAISPISSTSLLSILRSSFWLPGATSIDDLRPLAPQILEALTDPERGRVGRRVAGPAVNHATRRTTAPVALKGVAREETLP